MAEIFGIISGAVGIAAAFTACVDCFKYVQLGRNLARDYQTDQLSLTCAWLRLARPDATPAELRALKDCLFQILALFEESRRISSKYRSRSEAAGEASAALCEKGDSRVASLVERIKALAIGRQRGNSVLRKTGWALYHRSQLKELVSNITTIIDNMEKLFPAPETQLALVKQEIEQIRDRWALELVETATQGYLNVEVEGEAQLGDYFANDWKGEAVGAELSFYGCR
ncbi:unnamed protein product [Parascedosporium putredinis]|uniref:Prion-inhibition and propagation HeLo domain-containing protein n=1 Tax=Parascedosporium putredinis TaxID=1442378 RepID=A0A9P1MBI9_9PEZI|nr:unnamed protein product [Parascedosporium putredinis]CAI7994896.1 unnamed protein product [Parascedosporium putredinis]